MAAPAGSWITEDQVQLVLLRDEARRHAVQASAVKPSRPTYSTIAMPVRRSVSVSVRW